MDRIADLLNFLRLSIHTQTMPTVQSYVKDGFLTKKQGANLPGSYAMKVGANNKKKGRKPKPSLPKAVWEAKKGKRKTQKKKQKKEVITT